MTSQYRPTHYAQPQSINGTACGRRFWYLSSDLDKVDCKACQKTAIFDRHQRDRVRRVNE